MLQRTVRWVKKVDTERKLRWAAGLFWFAIVGAFISAPIAFIAQGAFGVILMTISWLALAYTSWDIIQTADVRDEQN